MPPVAEIEEILDKQELEESEYRFYFQNCETTPVFDCTSVSYSESLVLFSVVDATLPQYFTPDAWGRVLGVYDGSGLPLTQSAIGNRILWHARDYSWTTGIYYFRSRFYDSVSARWLSNDRIGIAGGLNQYLFCANNPVNNVDPFGLDWLMYNGTTLTWYGGQNGDTTKAIATYKATSGMPKQQTPSEHVNVGGPIPEGDYKAQIWLDIKQAEIDPTKNTLKPGWGIQEIPTYKDDKGQIQSRAPDWGFRRVRIDPKKGTDTHGRGGFYIHDSSKGYSHGCVETEQSFFDQLIKFREAGNKSIDFVIKYTGDTTYGGTKK